MCLRILALVVLIYLPTSLEVRAGAKKLPPKVLSLLKSGGQLIKKRTPKQRMDGAKLLLQAHKIAPAHFKTLVAAARACQELANLSEKSTEIKYWGKRGWGYAQRLVKRWPKRAEGHFWSAVNIGQYARGGGVWVAISQGLATKIEKYALASIKHNPKLYRGAAQKVIGRYYYRLPWPMRKLNKSLRYLKNARQQNPKDVGVMRFLADALWTAGKKQEARRLYQRCAKHYRPGLRKRSHAKFCKKWMAQ